MGHRLSKIYTRTGDDGTTGLGDGKRIAKNDLRVCAYGTIDETNSAIGIILTAELDQTISKQLTHIQHDLFDVGGELSIPDYNILTNTYTERVEQWIDQHNTTLTPLKNFILPGGDLAAAYCHLARTICRRAEREMVTLHQQTPINIHSIHYINRLSDYLFVIARVINLRQHGTEILWQREYSSQSLS